MNLTNQFRQAAGTQTITAPTHVIATKLTRVLLVVASYQTDLNREQMWVSAIPGDQAGQPANTFVLKTWRGVESLVTVDPIAAPEPTINFTSAPVVAWIAVGT